jgi:hypothetical protein
MLLRNTNYCTLMKTFILLVIIHCINREVVDPDIEHFFDNRVRYYWEYGAP